MSPDSTRIFLSIASGEFRSYRELLAGDLKGPHLEVKVQEDFIVTGSTTLEKLDDYIRSCHAIVHLFGDTTGSFPKKPGVEALLQRYPDLLTRLPILAETIADGVPQLSYTQWEAYLALYHNKRIHIYWPTVGAPRDALPDSAEAQAEQKALQQRHLNRLSEIERDRGEFANQERLSSQVLRALNDLLPPRYSKVRVSPSRLTHAAETLVGRDDALTRLDEAWNNPHKHVVVIRAWGGVGKTSLVATWMAEMALKDWRGATRVFDWSFYSQGTRQDGGDKAASADAFLADALKSFGDPDPQAGSPWDRGSRLARLVSETKSLLVLDGLEPLQHPPGPLAGQLKDPGVSALLKGLAGQNAGLCIVTTREKVDDLKTFYRRTADDWELSHLSDEAGAELLRTLGVVGTAKERREAGKQVQGHALTLQLMGRYLALAHDGDIRKRDLFKFTEADNETQGGHAFRVLKAYEIWVGGSGEAGRRELAILRLLGLFDRPADPGCLAALRKPPAIAGLTDELVSLTDAQWNIAVKRLEEIGLLTPVAHEAKAVFGYSEEIGRKALARSHQGQSMGLPAPAEFHPPSAVLHSAFSLDAHPLLREYFAKQLRRDSDAAWQAGHQRLFEHLQACVPYWPEGIDGLGPLYQAVAHGCESGLEERARAGVYRDRILRGTGTGGFYSVFMVGAIGADLGAVGCFFTQPWRGLSPNLAAADQAWLLSQAAFGLRALGRLAEAVEPMRAVLEMDIGRRDWKNAATSPSNLSELELTLGELAAAVADGKESVTFADRSQDAFQRMGKRTTYADALLQAGQRDEAADWFRDAEDLQAGRQPFYPQLYSLTGFRYCDLLLAEVECAAWRLTMLQTISAIGGRTVRRPNSLANVPQQQAVCENVARRCRQWMEWRTPGDSVLDRSLEELTIARIGLFSALLDPSSSPVPSCDRAVDGFRQAGAMHHLPRGLLTRAWARWLNGDEAGCKADLDEAWEIAEPGPMRLHMADILLTRARLFRDREALEQARKLIEQCGYHRRDGELADATEALA